MKGLLGQKIGMTQVFSEYGQAIPVSIIKIKPNVVSAILTKEKNGYDALQLSVEDKKTKKKPEIGHFLKAKTTPKKFIKEIFGMRNYKLGDKLDATIFELGELVDVTSISKGKGFSGAIKRHNQKIGPKSHGGGGGSKPTRQTGSLGDISGNKVFKGMTMPGQMGSQKTTIQNLEVISIDVINNILLVKGSIPGPNKSFVIVKNNIKKLSNKEIIKLVDLQEKKLKNELLEKAKKIDA